LTEFFVFSVFEGGHNLADSSGGFLGGELLVVGESRGTEGTGSVSWGAAGIGSVFVLGTVSG
jgi:hypothetical protein